MSAGWLWYGTVRPSGGRPIRVLVLGQTPPPVGGQSVMIEALLLHPPDGLELKHVRLAYSRSMVEMGHVSARKMVHLASVVARTWWAIWTFRPDVVLYPPGGPNRAPLLRDVVTLLAIRPFGRRLVLHHHAGGVADAIAALQPGGLRAIARRAFSGAAGAIVPAESGIADATALGARHVDVVANGVEDAAVDLSGTLDRRAREHEPRVLFVGVHLETKGVLVLADACRRLWEGGERFSLDLVGECAPAMERSIRARAGRFSERARLHGVLTGEAKWRRFAEADVLCLPSFFEAETFGLVCVEAMMFALPVVATTWRGIPDVVEDGTTGILVAPRDANALADALGRLLPHPALRHRMGEAGRRRYEARYSLAQHLNGMAEALVGVVARRP